tara:strand:+ start:756 stop:1151 length:396 start_codon:yes stop_codon:yes gene_type:complete
MDNSQLPRPIMGVKTQPLKCIYETRAKFVVVYNSEATISFIGPMDDDFEGKTKTGKYADIRYWAIEFPWAQCTQNLISELFSNPTKVDNDAVNYTGAAIFNWSPINVPGSSKSQIIQVGVRLCLCFTHARN